MKRAYYKDFLASRRVTNHVTEKIGNIKIIVAIATTGSSWAKVTREETGIEKLEE